MSQVVPECPVIPVTRVSQDPRVFKDHLGSHYRDLKELRGLKVSGVHRVHLVNIKWQLEKEPWVHLDRKDNVDQRVNLVSQVLRVVQVNVGLSDLSVTKDLRVVPDFLVQPSVT